MVNIQNTALLRIVYKLKRMHVFHWIILEKSITIALFRTCLACTENTVLLNIFKLQYMPIKCSMQEIGHMFRCVVVIYTFFSKSITAIIKEKSLLYNYLNVKFQLIQFIT